MRRPAPATGSHDSGFTRGEREPRGGSRERLVGLGVLTTLVVVFAFKILLVLFAGVLFALWLRAVAQLSARVTRLPYGVCVAALVVLGLGAIAVGTVLLAPRVEDEIQSLERELPKAVQQARERLGHAPIVDETLGPNPNPMAKKAEPKRIADTLVAALGGSLEVLGGLVVIFFVGVYGAAEPEAYARAALAVTPKRYQAHVRRALDMSGRNLTRWLLGRLVAMAFVGFTTSIAFHLLEIPLAPLLGIVAGVLTFIEYAGAIASAIPPVLLALARSPATALVVVLIYTALHVIEGYVLTPLLARASVRLPPALTLGAQVLLGFFAGPLGLTFSTPLFVVAVSAVTAWREVDERT